MHLSEILKRCSHVESRVAALYRSLAERFDRDPRHARLWRELALEEETHADILTRELRDLEANDEDPFLPDYVSRVENAEKQLAALEQRIQSLQSLDEAGTFSLALEQAELEDLYDDLLTQGHEEFKLISERLEAPLTARPADVVPGLPRR